MPASEDSTIQTHEYELSGSRALTLSVDVGYAQKGWVTVTLGGRKVAEGRGIEGQSIDANAGQLLMIAATVIDVRPETNMTSLVALLDGGPTPLPIRGSKRVQSNDVITYIFLVTFA